jgi:hypothetical protein
MKKVSGALLSLLIIALGVISPAMARSGTVTWSGRVDDKLEIVISGRSVSYRNISGNKPTDINYRFSETMPSENMNIRVIRRTGRGSVTVSQSPNRVNGYAAVIRIGDPNGGSDRYEFELRWDTNGNNNGNNNGNGNYGGGSNNGNGNGYNNGNSGNVGNGEIRWSGRVDGAEDIRIKGSNVSWSRVEGNGATNVNFRVGSPLPSRAVTCNVNKRQGRGQVYIRQQPNSGNNYFCIIRVVDKDSGDDFYDFTLRW